jgi:tRNA threonylcarbamoyladenosine biosynthesis protein TsaB
MPQIHHFLAIETSGSPGSVAVGTANGSPPELSSLTTHALPAAGSQGRDLMPTVVRAAAEAGWSLADVDLVAVAIGPGPFTGLRVGVTTAKAVAWSTDCLLVGVPTAACLAAQAVEAVGRPGRVAVVFAAGRGELFAITATVAGADETGADETGADEIGAWQLSPGSLTDPTAWLDAVPSGTVVTGPALTSDADLLAALTDRRPDLVLTPASAWQPKAATVASLGLAAAARGVADSAAAITPLYLRPSYAEDRHSTTS